ncbi:hypothetical protein [Alkaliphilus transvaalensis]|uniref:hypothetical protein n=1 Tax=Alkaliphilus transvaalensis TaxID=114628 RepID=UPI00047D820B|nr:hypothetical protein [Alkaliphilus transvaalensis]
MQLIQFRLYKKWQNEKLIAEIIKVSRALNETKSSDETQINYLNQLFREAKARDLSLNLKEMFNRMVFSIDPIDYEE